MSRASTSSPAVKRIMCEVMELRTESEKPDSFFQAAPLDEDLFEWHFSVRGPPDTAFEHGVYHGRILLPPEYPYRAPEIVILTPNGRFEVGTRICLSITSHHQETWQPSWGIRTIITALVGYMPSRDHGIGALDYPDDERRSLALKSHKFRCSRCGACPAETLPPRKKAAEGVAGSAAECEKAQAQGGASAGGPRGDGLADEDGEGNDGDASGFDDSDGNDSEGAGDEEDSHDHDEEHREEGRTDVAQDHTPVDEREARANLDREDETSVREEAPVAPVAQTSGRDAEKDLLYMACVLAVLISGILFRRLLRFPGEAEVDL